MNNQTNDQSIPVALVPTPTIEYRSYRKLKKSSVANGKPVVTDSPAAIPIPPLPPIPLPVLTGSRVLIYKQDPSVGEIGIRKAYLPSFAFTGPSDARIKSSGLPLVSKNAFGDFIQTPGTDSFDVVQTFAVVRMTLTLAQRVLNAAGLPNAIPWQWNSGANTEPLSVFAHGLPDTMNAFYSRSAKSLKFGDFVRPGSVPAIRDFTCRSFDIVAHETGHAILDALKPGWLNFSAPPQTGGLHESFGDLCAIFLALSQFDQVEAVIAQTKSNLHDKTFLSDLAEQFGLALGRPNGLRNADNDLKLSETGTEVHAISQVFTGGIYDILADIFNFEKNTALKDDAKVLYDCGQYLFGLILRAIVAAPANAATYADVVNQMLIKCAADGKPIQYRNFIRNRFTVRQVVVSPTPLTVNIKDGTKLKAGITDDKNAVQDRCTCCGTMKHEDYYDIDGYLEKETKELKKAFAKQLISDN
jgi:hypothetical protein